MRRGQAVRHQGLLPHLPRCGAAGLHGRAPLRYRRGLPGAHRRGAAGERRGGVQAAGGANVQAKGLPTGGAHVG